MYIPALQNVKTYMLNITDILIHLFFSETLRKRIVFFYMIFFLKYFYI